MPQSSRKIGTFLDRRGQKQVPAGVRNPGLASTKKRHAQAGAGWLQVVEYGRHDIVPGVAGDPSGYLVLTKGAGNIVYLKWTVRAVFLPGLLGCTQVTEIRYTPGMQLVAALPKEFEPATVYPAAVAAKAGQPQAARMMIDLLASPAAAELRRAGGFEQGTACPRQRGPLTLKNRTPAFRHYQSKTARHGQEMRAIESQAHLVGVDPGRSGIAFFADGFFTLF